MLNNTIVANKLNIDPAENNQSGMEIEKTKFEEINTILTKAGYQAIKSIGRGAFGEVLVVRNNENEGLYAVKVMSKQILRSKPFLRKYISQEINIMKKLNHPNIVRLYDSNQTNQFIILIMEYCRQGNLLSYQANLQDRAFSIINALHIITQILKGLKFIHENGFIHRDIKSENILIKLEQQGNNVFNVYKIADFGFARPIGKVGAKTHCGTQKYMAPQIVSNQSYGILVDMWALAVLFYFMLFTQYPFQAHDMKSEILRKCSPCFNVSSVLVKKQKANNISEQVKDFFKKVFVVDQRKRLTFSKIFSHPLFSPFRGQSQLQNYESVYRQLEKNQKFMKDDIQKIPQEFESEAEPEDQSRALLLQKIKQIRLQNNISHLTVYMEQLNFEIKKIMYLRECATQMYQNYSTYLTYAERLGAKFYLLRAFLFFCDPLLKRLQNKQMPEGFKQLKITSEIWRQCTQTQEYRKMVIKLQDEHLKNLFAYEDTYVLLQSIISQIQINGFERGYSLQIPERDFNQFKLGYRSMTMHLFRVIQNCQNMNKHLQYKIKMRIFCCHMINRVFMRQNIERNFPFFVQWLKVNKIKYKHSFDFTYFKRWILEQSSINLEGNINILHKNL